MSGNLNRDKAYTFALWFKSTVTPDSDDTILNLRTGSGSNSLPGQVTFFNTAGNLEVATYNGVSAFRARVTDRNYADGEWYHAVFSHYSNSTFEVYVDGIAKNISDAVETGTTFNGEGITLGKDLALGRDFNGFIDEVAIWNRSLSAQEIKDIYLRGTVRLNLTVRSCDDASCVGETFTDVINDTPKQVGLPTNASRYFQYRFNFITDDSDYSPQLYNVTIEVGNVSVYGATSPLITNVTPGNGTTFNLSQIVIGANATDADVDVLYLIANITYPNATFQQFVLTQQTNTNVYNISYTLPAAGAYAFTIIANDSNGLRTEQRGFFTVDLNFTKVINFTPQFVGYIGGVLNRTELNVTPGTFLQLNASDKLQELPDNQTDEGLCVAENSEITLADGTQKVIIDVLPGEHVLSLDEETGQYLSNKVTELLDMGTKPVYELISESGKRINTTSTHPYLVKLYDEEACNKYS